jgi:hypothetical protein
MKKWSFWVIVLGGVMTFAVVTAIWGNRRYQEVRVIKEKAVAQLKRAEAKLTAGVKRFMKDGPNSPESQEAVKLLKKAEGELHKKDGPNSSESQKVVKLLKKVEGELQKKDRPNSSESQKAVKLLKKAEEELQKLEPTPSPEK